MCALLNFTTFPTTTSPTRDEPHTIFVALHVLKKSSRIFPRPKIFPNLFLPSPSPPITMNVGPMQYVQEIGEGGGASKEPTEPKTVTVQVVDSP